MNDMAVAICARRGGFRLEARATFSFAGVTVILGPSGSGKTTLLRAIAGLERDVQGTIRCGSETWLDSERRRFVPPHRRSLGFVFQDGRVFPHLTVKGNLDYAERRADPGRRLDRDRIFDVFQLQSLIGRSSTTLSGGEIQRVALARALLTNPKLMLMDEPLSALDLPRRSEALSYIERVPEIFGIPILYVTHAIEEAARLGDRIAVLNEGKILAMGETADILSRLDLAAYLGRFEAGAVLEGIVKGEEPDFGISLVDVDGDLLQVPSLGLAKSQKVRLRIRARDVSIATARPEGLSIRNVIATRIAEVLEEKGTAFAELRLQGRRQVLRARITRLSVSELKLTPGREVYALVKSVAVDRQLLDGRRRMEPGKGA
ncbi:MAG TPA: molybdenum ABC transporter ATP-binding protein [Aestuariivirgaceae bacterium]|jgi:molybdate transport system ATP-binding protein